MTTIKVYPTKASALNAHHPTAGAPRVEGVDWPYDSFTCRRLTDGSFTEDASKAYKPAPSGEAEKHAATVASAEADKSAPIAAAKVTDFPDKTSR
jgi:hypothetical protein